MASSSASKPRRIRNGYNPLELRVANLSPVYRAEASEILGRTRKNGLLIQRLQLAKDHRWLLTYPIVVLSKGWNKNIRIKVIGTRATGTYSLYIYIYGYMYIVIIYIINYIRDIWWWKGTGPIFLERHIIFKKTYRNPKAFMVLPTTQIKSISDCRDPVLLEEKEHEKQTSHSSTGCLKGHSGAVISGS